MGANLSTPSPILQNPDSKSAETQNPPPKTLENQPQQISEEPTSPIEKGQDHNLNENTENIDEKVVKEGEEEEEEEGECGFCLFMKGGGCKDEFTAWEVCVDDVEKNKGNIVEKCYEVTQNLKKCMESNYEYYQPILRAEKAAEEQAKKELERVMEEKEKEANVGGDGVEEKLDIGAENEANVGSKGVEGKGEVGVENEENVGSKGVEESVDEIKVEKVKEAEG